MDRLTHTPTHSAQCEHFTLCASSSSEAGCVVTIVVWSPCFYMCLQYKMEYILCMWFYRFTQRMRTGHALSRLPVWTSSPSSALRALWKRLLWSSMPAVSKRCVVTSNNNIYIFHLSFICITQTWVHNTWLKNVAQWGLHGLCKKRISVLCEVHESVCVIL